MELVELASGRWGSPEQDIVDEVGRRLQVIAERPSPALAAMEATGLVGLGAEEQSAGGSAETAGGGA
ncbi:hypothetical protein [Kitasatospora sp. NPDC088134]|uniref:hypothetical protein n=1 Tax=Kitasatospora sp. NPDC088134 TaxID=3364071 RepID=UPI003817BADE